MLTINVFKSEIAPPMTMMVSEDLYELIRNNAEVHSGLNLLTSMMEKSIDEANTRSPKKWK